MINEEVWRRLRDEAAAHGAVLVAVSKTKPVEDIEALYALGQRDFGENYVQELSGKAALLPADLRWHFIGHLQSNKVKYIAPFVHLIHGVDSFRLLQEINRQAAKNGRTIDVLLQLYIAEEDTKFGLDEKEIVELMSYYEAQRGELRNVRICGLMGMATATGDEAVIRREFTRLADVFRFVRDLYFAGEAHFAVISMGMSGDYALALDAGSTLIRVGSLLFGAR
jgi:PLP dependent protein